MVVIYYLNIIHMSNLIVGCYLLKSTQVILEVYSAINNANFDTIIFYVKRLGHKSACLQCFPFSKWDNTSRNLLELKPMMSWLQNVSLKPWYFFSLYLILISQWLRLSFKTKLIRFYQQTWLIKFCYYDIAITCSGIVINICTHRAIHQILKCLELCTNLI